MNRPNELLKELQDFNETSFGLELSAKDCKELFNYIFELEEYIKKKHLSDFIDDYFGWDEND